MEHVERIVWRGKQLAYLVRADANPEETTFVTPPELNLQLGFVVYPEGGEVARHEHRPLQRHIVGTSEVIVVKKGRCAVDIYNNEHELVATRELQAGDVVFMVDGGHGFRASADTVLMEVKQGPYTGEDEKERF